MKNKAEMILPLKEQYIVADAIKKLRINTLLPRILKECNVDMWLILAGECNEDPIFTSIVPGVVDHASRLTCIVFTMIDGVFGAYSLNKPNRELGKFYTQLPYNTDTQWHNITQFIKEKNPKNIAINISEHSSLGAGLSKALYDELLANLSDMSDRLISADQVSVRWLEWRTDEELAMYSAIYDVTTTVMSETFSKKVVVPGITTTDDLEDYAAEEFRKMGLPTCFRPTINLQRKGESGNMITGTVRHGDLLHYDAGIQYLGLCTDLQRLAYVLKPGESEAPKGIIDGFTKGHRFGALVAKEFKTNRTGNEVFYAAKEAAKEDGIDATLYSHPIGIHCHGAGPTIGLYDKQGFIEGKGERKLHKNTAYALEFNIACPVAEWCEQYTHFYLEETVTFTQDGELNYLDNQWDKLILI